MDVFIRCIIWVVTHYIEVIYELGIDIILQMLDHHMV